jgi:hypothetical protein
VARASRRGNRDSHESQRLIACELSRKRSAQKTSELTDLSNA